MMTAANDNRPTRFVVGQTYSVRSICDSDVIFSFTVTARTDKTLTLKSSNGKEVRRKVSLWDGRESCAPHGRYSMAAILTPDRVTVR